LLKEVVKACLLSLKCFTNSFRLPNQTELSYIILGAFKVASLSIINLVNSDALKRSKTHYKGKPTKRYLKLVKQINKA